MVYEDDLKTLIWNGEIYNRFELENKAKKLGFSEQTASLERIMIYLFSKYGVKLFTYLNGKFTIIIWDKQNEILYGASDRFGIEALYYTEETGHFYVTNCKRNLENEMNSETDINHHALQHYFTFQYVPEPLSLKKNCFKLSMCHFFIKKANESVQKFAYFSPEITPLMYSNKEKKIKEIQKTLYKCVSERMQTNIKVGSFLSGGIDSTIITSIAQQLNPKIKTFTIAFSETGYSEINIAERTVEFLGLEHKNIIVTPEKFIQAIPAMIYYLEQPLADPSAVPLYIGFQEAKREVDILFSGEGADEMFGGYEIYREHESLKFFQFVPRSLQRPLLKLVDRFPESMKGKSFLYRGLTPLKDRYVGNAKIFEEQEKEILLSNYCSNSMSMKWLKKYFDHVSNSHPMEQMQYIDWHTWLPGDILFKATRLSQAAQLCIRLPFVDRKIYEIAKGLTVDEKIANKMTKVILREAAKGIVPDYILQEKKRGFPVPLRKWLRDDLYIWANRNITNAKTTDFINKNYAIELLDEHHQGKHDHSRKLWAIIIFNLWYEIFIEKTNLYEKPWQLTLN